MADLYSVLGVSRTADAAEMKRAYRKLAKEFHPDRNKDNPNAAEKFKKITAAYDILSDEKRRGQYDRGEIDEDGNPKFAGFGGGNGGFRGHPGGGFGGGFGGGEFNTEDLFSELFGRGGMGGMGGGMGGRSGFRPQRGADVSYRLKVSFADAALAKSVRLSLRNGKTIDLNIPKGVEEGRQLRLTGQGEQGPGGSGDAMVTLIIQPDHRFTRDGFDLRTDIMVPLEVAVLGGKHRVPTPEADVMLTIAPDSNSGKIMRLKGKGWTKPDGTRGDLFARILVDVPHNEALKAFLQSQQSQNV